MSGEEAHAQAAPAVLESKRRHAEGWVAAPEAPRRGMVVIIQCHHGRILADRRRGCYPAVYNIPHIQLFFEIYAQRGVEREKERAFWPGGNDLPGARGGPTLQMD